MRYVINLSWKLFAGSNSKRICVRGTGPAYLRSIACTVADNSGRPRLHSSSSPLSRAWRSVRSTNQNNWARKAELLHRSSSCLELTAASTSLPIFPSQSVSSRARDSSLAFHLLFLRTTEGIELN